jgi:hypothetical protein
MSKNNGELEAVEKALIGCLAVPFVLIVGVPLQALAICLQSWVAVNLWEWFVVNQFGVRPLNIALAAGLLLLVELFTNHPAKRDFGDTIGSWFIRPLLLLLFGWLIHAYLV